MTDFRGYQMLEVEMRDRLSEKNAEIAALRAALCDVRMAIVDVYGVNKHSIVDTVWCGPTGIETVVDRIDAALVSAAPGETP